MRFALNKMYRLGCIITGMKTIVYTIGHSTRSFDELVEILDKFGVKQLVDIRTVPRSRTNPQFNQKSLEQTLPPTGIDYTHLAKLGGLRKTSQDSANQGWRNASFRGYADYMQTTEFRAGLAELTKLADDQTTAIMCAEAVPWRCHRSMVGDALLVHGYDVQDIFDIDKATPEKLTSFAQVDGTDITYPNDPTN